MEKAKQVASAVGLILFFVLWCMVSVTYCLYVESKMK